MRSPLYRLIALGASLAIAAIIYFAVINPSSNSANNAVNSAEKQVQKAVQQANSQSGGAVPTGVTNLVNCLAAAGTNTGAIQACKAKFQP